MSGIAPTHNAAAQPGHPAAPAAETNTCCDLALKIAAVAAAVFVTITLFAALPLPLALVCTALVLGIAASLYCSCFSPAVHYNPIPVVHRPWWDVSPLVTTVYAGGPRFASSWHDHPGRMEVPILRASGPHVPVGGGHMHTTAFTPVARAADHVAVGGGHAYVPPPPPPPFVGSRAPIAERTIRVPHRTPEATGSHVAVGGGHAFVPPPPSFTGSHVAVGGGHAGGSFAAGPSLGGHVAVGSRLA